MDRARRATAGMPSELGGLPGARVIAEVGMTLTHEKAGNLAKITATGGHHQSEIEALVPTIISVSAPSPPIQLLFDLRLYGVFPDAQALKDAGFRPADLRPRLSERHAFVVRGKPQYGLAREVAGWAGTRGVSVGIFGGEGVDDAVKWLSGQGT